MNRDASNKSNLFDDLFLNDSGDKSIRYCNDGDKSFDVIKSCDTLNDVENDDVICEVNDDGEDNEYDNAHYSDINKFYDEYLLNESNLLENELANREVEVIVVNESSVDDNNDNDCNVIMTRSRKKRTISDILSTVETPLKTTPKKRTRKSAQDKENQPPGAPKKKAPQKKSYSSRSGQLKPKRIALRDLTNVKRTKADIQRDSADLEIINKDLASQDDYNDNDIIEMHYHNHQQQQQQLSQQKEVNQEAIVTVEAENDNSSFDRDIKEIEDILNLIVDQSSATQIPRVEIVNAQELQGQELPLQLNCYCDFEYDKKLNYLSTPPNPSSSLHDARLLHEFTTATTPLTYNCEQNQMKPIQDISTTENLDNFERTIELFMKNFNQQYGLNVTKCANIESYPNRKINFDELDNDKEIEPKQNKKPANNDDQEEEKEDVAEEEIETSRSEINLRETSIEQNELRLELEKAAQEYEESSKKKKSKTSATVTVKSNAKTKTNDTKNKFDYTVDLFEEIFSRDELETGIIGDSKNCTRSKNRTVFEEAKIHKIKMRLKRKFELDDDYLEELWSNMRPDLNAKLTRRWKSNIVVSNSLFKKS